MNGPIGRWSGPAAIVAICAGLRIGGNTALVALRYDRAAIAAGAWWRVVGCAFVHLNGWHLALNMVGVATLAALQPAPVPVQAWLWRTAALSVGMCALLWWLAPQVADYAGVSGPLYGLCVLGLAPAAWRGDRLAGVALAVLVAVTATELLVGAPAAEARLIGGPVVPASHAAGIAAALGYAALARLARNARQRPA